MHKSPLVTEISSTVQSDHPINILLVDDKRENLYSLEQLLEDDEYEANFIKCTSGNEALNIALKEKIALILLDVQMPEMDGYEVAKFLKQNKKTSAIPLIFVTALDYEMNYILEGYKKGAVDYLLKPLNPAITRAKVRAFIHTYHQQQELERKNFMLENLAMLVNNSVDLMCILDARSLHIESTNPAWEKILGLNADALLGKPITNLPGALEGFASLYAPKEDVVLFENYLPSTNNTKIWFSWSFVRKNDLWYGNGKDITKNKMIEEKLAQANEALEKKVLERTADLLSVNEQLKDEIKRRSGAEEALKHYNERLLKTNEELDSFVYVASHDLKAPIANIESLFNILNKKLKDKINDDDEKLFSMVGHSLNKFNTILKDLGRIISIQDDLEADYTNVSIKEILDDTVEDIKDLIEKNNAQIEIDLSVEHVTYAAKHVRSILYNLISNAIKYRCPKRDPIVEVKSWEEKNYVVLSVKDNGMGLTDNQKNRMFSMFRRFHTHVDGSGIGLYMLKKIISNNGGKIELESTESVGSEFKVYLKKVAI